MCLCVPLWFIDDFFRAVPLHFHDLFVLLKNRDLVMSDLASREHEPIFHFFIYTINYFSGSKHLSIATTSITCRYSLTDFIESFALMTRSLDSSRTVREPRISM